MVITEDKGEVKKGDASQRVQAFSYEMNKFWIPYV